MQSTNASALTVLLFPLAAGRAQQPASPGVVIPNMLGGSEMAGNEFPLAQSAAPPGDGYADYRRTRVRQPSFAKRVRTPGSTPRPPPQCIRDLGRSAEVHSRARRCRRVRGGNAANLEINSSEENNLAPLPQ